MSEPPVGASSADPLFPPAGSGSRGQRRPRSRTRTIITIVGVVVLALIAAFVLKQCAGNGGGARGGRPQTTVGVVRAVYGDMPIQLQALGTVTPLATTTVTSRIAGNLTRIAFTEGQMVKAGQVLAVVDERPYQVALEQAQAQLVQAQASLANAQLLLKRDQTLLAEDSVARQDVDTQAATVKQDEGAVLADAANVNNARLNLGYCRIVAPITGKAGLRQVDVGNYVGTSNGLVILTQIDPIDVTFTIPEDELPTLVQRMRSGAVLPVSALDKAGGQTLAQGRLLTLDNQIDVTTGTVKAKARFANANASLFPQQFINVQLLVDTQSHVVIVPASAIRHGPSGDFVWIMQADHTAHMQTVKVGPTLGEQTAIQSGVTAGQQVITEGGDRLREGAPVSLPGQRPNTGAGGPGGRKGGRKGGGGGGF
ncbi:MAG TPA: efflux RND transporter periplasmic adaptor subunit [Caulobacteraceae bacterium]